jgi:hypothetical protein
MPLYLNPQGAVAALQPTRSPNFNGAAALAFRPLQSARLVQVGYSYSDLTGGFNPATDQILGRLAIVQGIYPYDYSQFSIFSSLIEFRVLYECGLNVAGPVIIPFFQSDNGVVTDPGAGLTILLSPPIWTFNGHIGFPQFTALITASSIQVPLYGTNENPRNNGATAQPGSPTYLSTNPGGGGSEQQDPGGGSSGGAGAVTPTQPGGPIIHFTPGVGAGGGGGVHGGPGAR